VRIAIGAVLTVVAFAAAGRRLWWLSRLVGRGSPASPTRTDDMPGRIGKQITEVFGQRRLLKWSVPGLAHFFTFWGFVVLFATIVEAYGDEFQPTFHIPLIGRMGSLGFLEDFFAVMVLVALAVFAALRVREAPKRLERSSRFYGSHTRAAWVILAMIAAVIVTLLVYRGAQVDTGHFPYSDWAFASHAVGAALHPLGVGANKVLETLFIQLQLAVVLGFLVLVVYSKHLHIFLAPLNVTFARRPDSLGPLASTPDMDMDNITEDTVFGAGKIEDFSWKMHLDLTTCTECGRCQSQCPAWNTGKPLSPKMLIMDLRDHMFAKAPYLLAGGDTNGLPAAAVAESERPLVAALADGGVIDPDVLWSCTNCGACVEQCPVDIEHIDHIEDMRRYQVLIESSFPSEAGTMMRNLENNGNPWGVSPRSRTEWYADLAFEVRTVEPGQALPDDVEYLYWVGCAGAIEDRSRRTTRAFAELLHTADVSFAVLGAAETCSGDPARRMGNEYLFQTLARQNIETLNGIGATKIVMTCPHCFNSLGREYPALGGTYEVVHHTQLLARLVSERRLVPVTPVEGTVTYHDPCFLGRHNRVYSPPREVLESISGLRNQEMHRCKERGFCCGAGGARMWMEERIGKKINVERADEALGLDPDMVSTACPFCMVMLSDAVTAKQQAGQAREGVEVLDVAQILARSLVAPSGTVVEDPTPAVAPEPSASTATVEAPPPGDLPPG
jgi:Fe-S oxidoreductase